MSILEHLIELIERKQHASKSGKLIMIHGTTNKILKSILVNGLNPNPKQKTWEIDTDASFDIPSRISYGGIYFSQNIITALSSARNAKSNLGGSNALIVVCQIQPRTALPDEDDIQTHIGRALRFSVGYEGKSNPTENSHVWAYYSYITNNEDHIEFVTNFRKHLINALCETKEMKEACHKDKNIINKINHLYESALKRKLVHINPFDQSKYLEDFLGKDFDLINKYIITDKSSIEREYIESANNIMPFLNRFLMNKINDNDMFTLRVMEPIGFTGSNKIISIFEVDNYLDPTRKDVKFIVHYGTIPKEIIDDYKNRIGKLVEIVSNKIN